MLKPAKPDNEAERLRALQRYQVLDSTAEAAFDDLVAIAAAICDTPMGAVTRIDSERQWFKARLGLADGEGPRDDSFCAHAILSPHAVLVVPDAQLDARFHDNPAVLGDPHVRFYAGAPILSVDGLALGSMCVIDSQPRELKAHQIDALNALSRQVAALLELRRVSRDLKMQLHDREWYEEQLQRFHEILEAHNAELSEQVKRDALTGLSNRRAFGAALEQAIAAQRPFCVAVIDIDHFKAVNDTHGHLAGDAVLTEIASVLRAASGGHGTVARYGGEEFAWLLPELDLDQAQLQCEYLRVAVSHASQALPVTISIGVAAWQAGENGADMFHRADAALYAAKKGGRNRVVAG